MLGVLLGGLLLLVAIVVLIKLVPPWVASTDGLKGKDRAEEIGRARTAVLAILAGTIATVGAVFTGLSYRLNRQGHELDRAGQLTERFTRAIDQLGSESLDVRLGGIYALERIARDSADDHPQVMEVLTAYVREHARPPASLGRPQAGADDADEPDGGAAESERPSRDGEPELPTDVQAAMTVIGRRDATQDRDGSRLDLSRTDLRRLVLTADAANLQGAVLRRADLRGANLIQANLRGAGLFEANLQGANLFGADLQGAGLFEADLQGADLTGADLQDAYPIAVDLQGAVLRRADLRGADLTGADLQGAMYDDNTRPPEGLDLKAAGARHVNQVTGESDSV